MSPVRRHFWQLVARVKSSFTLPRKWSLNWFMPAGVNSTDGSQVGTSTSLGQRLVALGLEECQVLFAQFVGGNHWERSEVGGRRSGVGVGGCPSLAV